MYKVLIAILIFIATPIYAADEKKSSIKDIVITPPANLKAEVIQKAEQRLIKLNWEHTNKFKVQYTILQKKYMKQL